MRHCQARLGHGGIALSQAFAPSATVSTWPTRRDALPPLGSFPATTRSARPSPPRLARVDSGALPREEARALGLMRRVFSRDLGTVTPPSTASSQETKPSCTYGDDPDSLSSALYACYGWAQSHVVVGTDTLDRLSILGSLGRTEDPARRRELFLALEPVWRSVNSDNGPASPTRAPDRAESRSERRRQRHVRDTATRVQARGRSRDVDHRFARANWLPSRSSTSLLAATCERARDSSRYEAVRNWVLSVEARSRTWTTASSTLCRTSTTRSCR